MAGWGQGVGRDGGRELRQVHLAWDPKDVWVPGKRCLMGALSPTTVFWRLTSPDGGGGHRGRSAGLRKPGLCFGFG